MDNNVSTGLPITRDQVVEELVKCGYLDAAYTKEKFGNVVLNPAGDPNIIGPTGIFTDLEFNAAGTDAIKVGFIYRPATVSPIGETAVLNTGEPASYAVALQL